jgi:hypothetical protein
LVFLSIQIAACIQRDRHSAGHFHQTYTYPYPTGGANGSYISLTSLTFTANPAALKRIDNKEHRTWQHEQLPMQNTSRTMLTFQTLASRQFATKCRTLTSPLRAQLPYILHRYSKSYRGEQVQVSATAWPFGV